MVAAPAAIALATVDRDLAVSVSTRGRLLSGAAVLAVGVGTGAVYVAAAGLVVLAVAWLLRGDRRSNARTHVAAYRRRHRARRRPHSRSCCFALDSIRRSIRGIRRRFGGVIDVIARRQYDVPGLWPRRAPLWLQIGNLFQYVDWQFALGLDQWVGALVAPHAVHGRVRRVRRRRERVASSARSALVGARCSILVASATLGVVLYLNLKAGPSFGYGVLPPNADREARERDYFFALGFAAFGLWTGHGCVAFCAPRRETARATRRSAGAGVRSGRASHRAQLASGRSTPRAGARRCLTRSPAPRSNRAAARGAVRRRRQRHVSALVRAGRRARAARRLDRDRAAVAGGLVSRASWRGASRSTTRRTPRAGAAPQARLAAIAERADRQPAARSPPRSASSPSSAPRSGPAGRFAVLVYVRT